MEVCRDEYEKRLEGMGEIFKNMLEDAYKQALAFASNNSLPPTIRRIEITGGASKTLLLVNIMNEFCANKMAYEVGLPIHIFIIIIIFNHNHIH